MLVTSTTKTFTALYPWSVEVYINLNFCVPPFLCYFSIISSILLLQIIYIASNGPGHHFMNFLHPPRAVLPNYPFSSLVFVSGMSVYNVVILSILGVAITSIIRDHQDATFAITAVFTIFCTTLTLCFVFLPKVSKGELRRSDRHFIGFGDVGAQTMALNILTFYRAFSHNVKYDPPYWFPKTPINK